MEATKIIAFFLPQFHPFPENNQWWGTGFTEWTNVSSAKSRFSGHYQPHIPADLGFYDLRVAETREDQAKLAREHLIDGFCYYHYWFSGTRLMKGPIDSLLLSKKPDFPFCFCWANESWSRAWDGQEREILIKQEYSAPDNIAHFEFLKDFFLDSRYIRINDKPIFAIYRPDSIPNIKNLLDSWQDLAMQSGLKGIHFCGIKSGLVNLEESEIISLGFDSVIDFQPNRDHFPTDGPTNIILEFLRKSLPNSCYQFLKRKGSAVKRISYAKFVEMQIVRQLNNQFKSYPTVFPSWDNTARRKTPTVIENHDAKIFGNWLDSSIRFSKNSHPDHPVVFINAWNEWAEGCHLEPDRFHGKSFLESARKVILKNRG